MYPSGGACRAGAGLQEGESTLALAANLQKLKHVSMAIALHGELLWCEHCRTCARTVEHVCAHLHAIVL